MIKRALFLLGALILTIIIANLVMGKKFYKVEVVDTADVPISTAWKILAEDFHKIHQYSEFVNGVEIIGDKPIGPGCVRRCSLADGGFMQEEIGAWEENKRIEIVIQDSSMPMVPGTSIMFELNENDNGKITIRAVGKYRVKYIGFLSPLVAKSKYKDLLAYLIGIVKQAA